MTFQLTIKMQTTVTWWHLCACSMFVHLVTSFPSPYSSHKKSTQKTTHSSQLEIAQKTGSWPNCGSDALTSSISFPLLISSCVTWSLNPSASPPNANYQCLTLCTSYSSLTSGKSSMENWKLSFQYSQNIKVSVQDMTHILCHIILTLRENLVSLYFRYTLPTNTILRKNILKKGGSADRYMSIGADGFKALVKKFYMHHFTFEDLDLPRTLSKKGIDNPEKLPNFYYRDDGLRLWNAISDYCFDVLNIFYKTDEDVQMDSEIQAWIEDIHERGFSGLSSHQREGLPRTFDNVDQLSETMTKILFTSTCQHSATHSEALDMYGFLPLTPAMMRLPPPTKKRMVGREIIVKTLPDQSPEAYYGSLANVMQFHKPDAVSHLKYICPNVVSQCWDVVVYKCIKIVFFDDLLRILWETMQKHTLWNKLHWMLLKDSQRNSSP